jgi:hypothetical protein
MNTCGIAPSSACVTSLFFPRFVSDANQSTGIALVNADSEAATLRFTAIDGNGATVQGPNITNPATRNLNAGSQLALGC